MGPRIASERGKPSLNSPTCDSERGVAGAAISDRAYDAKCTYSINFLHLLDRLSAPAGCWKEIHTKAKTGV